MAAEANPRLVAAMQRLVGGQKIYGQTTPAGTGSDTVAETIRTALDAIEEMLADPALPRGTRVNLEALRPVLSTMAAVTLRWEELLSTAVVELRSPIGSEERSAYRAEFAKAAAASLPTEDERRAMAERLVGMVREAVEQIARTAGEAIAEAMAALPKAEDQEALAKRLEDAARRGARAAVQTEFGAVAGAMNRRTASRVGLWIASAAIVGLLGGAWMTRAWVSYAIAEAAQIQVAQPRR